MSSQPPALSLSQIRDYIDEKIQEGDSGTAATLCEDVLISFPQENPYFIKALALCYQNLHEHQKAVGLLKQAVALYPEDAELRASLGYAYVCDDQEELGEEQLRLALNKGSESIFVNDILAKYYFRKQQFLEATSFLEYILEKQPSKAILARLGIAYLKLQLWEKTELVYRRMFDEYGESRDAVTNLYNAYVSANKKIEAYETAQKLVEEYPEYANHFAFLMLDSKGVCDWESYETAKTAFEGFYLPQRLGGMTPFVSLVCYDDPYQNYQCARMWHFLKNADNNAVVHEKFNVDKNAKKIRIGYLSRDFYHHATMHLISGLFHHHDRDKFEIYVYSYGPQTGDPYEQLVRSHCDKFYYMQHFNDKQIWQQIHNDGVHILVDLKGHTNSARVSVMESRLAPIQVQYLGFPGTSGSDAMDYIITDKTVTPPEHAGFYSEKPAYMPHSYQANDAMQKIGKPQTRAENNLPEDAIVFAVFNQNYKTEPAMFKIWCEILHEVKNSVLWLAHSNDLAVENITKYAQQHGIDKERLCFYQGTTKDRHLARIQLADICLDTHIVNGHTSTSDSLFAGVPVISYLGNHFASRVSASLLGAIGMDELIAKDREGYKILAIEIAKDPERLRALKEKLAHNKKTEPLYDSARFTRNLESLYQEMWQRYKDDKAPASLHFTQEENVEPYEEADRIAASQVVYLHWYTGTPNWGDSINPALVEAISGKKPIYHHPHPSSKRPFYLCTGSVMALANEHSIVWGAGFMSENSILKQKPKQICAVRGPLTRQKLVDQGIECPKVYGDPALLYPRFYQPKVTKKYKLGIVPHYVDQDNPWFAKKRKDVLVIDVKTDDIQGFIDQLASCEYIASSSLHGMIAADAYGIPSTWLRFSDKVLGGDFKFMDYFASVGRTDTQPLMMQKRTKVTDIMAYFTDYTIDIDLDKLMAACPFAKQDGL
jgi:protein O-GlcNAc transferase